MNRHRLFVCVVWVALCLTAAKGQELVFEKLPVSEGVASASLSPDGKTLFVAHHKDNLITVWDVATVSQKCKIACPTPRFLLIRRNTLYAGTDRGIAAFDASADYKPLKTLTTLPNVYFLSAADEANFDGRLYASCAAGSAKALGACVDTASGESTVFVPESIRVRAVHVDPSGKHVIVTPYSTFAVSSQNLYEWAAKGPSTSSTIMDILVPCEGGEFWLMSMSIFKGMPPQLAGDPRLFSFPPTYDGVTKTVYSFGPDKVFLYGFSQRAFRKGALPASYPAELRPRDFQLMTEPFTKEGLRQFHQRRVCPPLAATVDGTLNLLAINCRTEELYWARAKGEHVLDQADAYSRLSREEKANWGKPPPPPAEFGPFKPLPLSEPAATFALTEDGRHVLVAHELANRITVLETATAREVKSIACPNPRFILCRGNRAFVANYAEGAITTIDCKEWKVLDQAEVGAPRVFYLSAPAGRYCKNILLAVCGADPKGASDDPTFHRVDIAADRHSVAPTQLARGGPSIVTLDYSGQMAMEQHGLHRQSARRALCVEQAVYFSRRPGGISHDPGARSIPYLQQFHNVPIWVGGNSIWSQAPVRRLLEQEQPVVALGDVVQPAVYLLYEDKIVGRRLAPGAPVFFQAPARCPLTPPRDLMEREQWDAAVYKRLAKRGKGPNPNDCIFAPPLAASLDGKLFAFVLHHPGGQLYRAEFPLGGTVPAGSPHAASPDATPVRGQHDLLHGQCHLVLGLGGQSLLLLEGSNLRVLDADAQAVLRQVELPEPCVRIFERSATFVAHTDTDVLVLDKKTLQLVKRIALPCSRINDLVLHPRIQASFAAVQTGQENLKERLDDHAIVAINETAGVASPIKGAFGQHIAMHPQGLFLYASLHDTFHKGFVEAPWGDTFEVRGLADALVAYRVESLKLTPASVNRNPGPKGTGLVIAPDGRTVAFMSTFGYQVDERKPPAPVAAFDASDVRRIQATYGAQGHMPACTGGSFHPTRDLFAAILGGKIAFFQRSTGKPLGEAMVDFEGQTLQDINQVLFTPGGKHLLVRYSGAQGRRLLRAFPLAGADATKGARK